MRRREDYGCEGNDTGQPAMRVLFAGGCQVAGYPVGLDSSFPAVAARQLKAKGVGAEVEVMGYLKLSHFEKLAERLSKNRADSLVLQVGHFELTPRDLMGGRSGSTSASQGVQPPAPKFETAAGRARWICKDLIKRLALALFDREPDPATPLHRPLEEFLGRVGELGLRQVVVLSPLPCADGRNQKRRQSAARFFRELSARFGFDFVDILAEPQMRGSGLARLDYFYDEIHLNARGHELVAARIVHELSRRFRRGWNQESESAVSAALAGNSGSGAKARPS